MSSDPPQTNKSPGKGGKSLQLMQQRLMAHQSQGQQQQQQPQQLQTTPNQTAPAPTAPSVMQMPAQQNQMLQSQSSPSAGRPKGKDFAAMSANARMRPAPQAHQPQPPVANNPTHVTQMPQTGKPKGKDFSAMASRMGGPPSQPVPVPVTQPSTVSAQASHAAQMQASRAAQMQAAARAAAGLPPLERPTATSVTTTPPEIPKPKLPPSAPYNPRPSMSSQVLASTHPAPSTANQARRNSKTLTPAPAPARKSNKPTPAPTASESRLSMAPPVAAPHLAPPIGPRIQSLVHELDPTYTIETAAEEQVLQLADDFLDKVIQQSLRLAQHRGSKTLDVQDIQFVLAKQWNITIPGLGPPTLAAKKKSNISRSTGIAGQKRKANGSAATNSGKIAKTFAGANATANPVTASAPAPASNAGSAPSTS